MSYGVFEPVNTNNAQPIPKVQAEPIVEDILNDIENIDEPPIIEASNDEEVIEEIEVTDEQVVEENIDVNQEMNSVESNDNLEDMTSIDDVIDGITSKIEEQNQTDTSSEESFSDSDKQEEVKEEKELVVELEEEDDDIMNRPVPPTVSENVIVRNANSVPIYETDTPKGLPEDELPFKVGDRVYHPKHGNGTIEAFANYSNKILFCHIDFDKVGRRILDPRVSGIEKISII